MELSDGMHYAWTGPTIPLLQKNDTRIQIAGEDHIWLESVYLIGGLVGVPITIFLVDRFGRKYTILISAISALISWILIAVATNVTHLYLARFLVGVTGDVSFVATPMYVAEIADKTQRGLLSGLIYVMFLVGILIMYLVGPLVPLYVPSLIGCVIVSVHLLIFPFMPESPYFLVKAGNVNKARSNLTKFRGTECIESEMSDIIAAVERQELEKGRVQDLLLDKGNRKALSILFVLNSAQHFSSISVVLMNLQNIFTVADSIYLSAYTSGAIFSALMLVAAIIADVVVDKFGRKMLVIVSSVLCAICLLVLAVYFTLQKNSVNVATFSWIPIISVMLYGFCFKLGLGMVPIVMTAELFSTKVKAVGMAVADFFYLGAAWLSIELYQRLITSVGYDYPFYIFSACCLLTALFTKVYIPETKGKTLEEIQIILKDLPPSIPSRSTESDKEAKF